MSAALPANLKTRAFMLRQAREFFFERNIMEVDCPILTQYASVDTHIDLICSLHQKEGMRYLHSSPEYGMKRLLSIHPMDIYQLSHVFRDEEAGIKHNPEFMMAEWYRMNFTFDQMIEETNDFIKLFLGNLPTTRISYREAFQKYAGIDYLHCSENELLKSLKQHGIAAYPGIIDEGKDALLNLILGTVIEKELGLNEITALYHYPASQSALAKTRLINEETVAERFEIYYQGIELCNGYHELLDSKEQKKRFVKSNLERISLQKKELPIDEYFIEALEKGLPPCSGVAVGFDRLMMLRSNAKHIEEVLPFAWNKA